MKLIDLANRRRAALLATPFVYDTDMQAVIDKAIAESFDLPPMPTLKAMNTLILNLKSDGIWSKLDTLFNFATGLTGYEDFTRICLKRRVLGTDNGTLTFTTEGREGNATDYYFDAEFTPDVDAVNYLFENASRLAVAYFVSGGGTGTDIIDCILSGTTNNVNILYASNTPFNRINQLANVLSSSANLSGTGLKTINRTSSKDVMLTNKDVEINRTATSNISGFDSKQGLFKRGLTYGNLGLSLYGMGASLTYAETQDLRTAYNQYLETIGLTQFA